MGMYGKVLLCLWGESSRMRPKSVPFYIRDSLLHSCRSFSTPKASEPRQLSWVELPTGLCIAAGTDYHQMDGRRCIRPRIPCSPAAYNFRACSLLSCSATKTGAWKYIGHTAICTLLAPQLMIMGIVLGCPLEHCSGSLKS
jgi:hypothetical protein